VTAYQRFYRFYSSLLEYITIVLMVGLLVVVTLGFTYRWAGNSLSWYDEVAAIMLCWLTYYSAALGALKRAHIGIPSIVVAVKPAVRIPLVIFGEIVVIGFFVILAWMGVRVLGALEGQTLISIPVPLQITQSVIPIGSVLFIIAEVLNLPEIWKEATGHIPMKSTLDPPMTISHACRHDPPCLSTCRCAISLAVVAGVTMFIAQGPTSCRTSHSSCSRAPPTFR
jgi:TRAP-type C4-dicarboxylate transport system permease small subunit